MSVGESASKLLQLELVIWCLVTRIVHLSVCQRTGLPEPFFFFVFFLHSAESEGKKKEEKKEMCNTVRNTCIHCMAEKWYIYSLVGER